MKSRYSVLIVDDDPVSLAMIEAVCSSAGFQVEAERDVSRALMMAQAGDYQIVIADWNMPEMRGVDLCRQLRHSQHSTYTYFVLVSAHDGSQYLNDCIDAEVDQFIPKPVASSVLKLSLLNASRILDLQRDLLSLNTELPKTRQSLERDLFLLRQLQLSMMPGNNDRVGDARLHVYSRPYSILSGDQCGAFQIDHSTLGFYLVDVVGHGIPAAIRALGFSRLFSSSPSDSVIFRNRDNPDEPLELRSCGEVLSVLNSVYQVSDEDSAYVCAVYGLFNRHTKRLEICLAGMPQPFLIRDGARIETIGKPDLPLGLMQSHRYESQVLTVEDTDQLLMMSDGLIEVIRGGSEVLGFEAMEDLIASHSANGLSALIQKLKREIEDWSDKERDQVFSDDVTVLGIDFFAEQIQFSAPPRLNEGAFANTPTLLPRIPKDEHDSLQVAQQSNSLRKANAISTALLVFDSDDLYESAAAQFKCLNVDVRRIRSGHFLRENDPLLKGVDLMAVEARDGSFKGAKWVELIREFLSERLPYILICYASGELRQAAELMGLGADSFIRLPCDQIGLQFNLETAQRHIELQRSVESKTVQLAKLRAEIQADMKQVALMQTRTLPKSLPEFSQLAIDWVFKPADQVSGDFLGTFKISRSVIGFFAIDATGQGVLASIKGWAVARLITGVDKSESKAFIHEADGISGLGVLRAPSKVLKALNARVRALPAGYRLDCSVVYGTLDCETGEGIISHAGHPIAALSTKEGQAHFVGKEGPRIGAADDSAFSDVIFVLRPGDRLNLYSDGLPQTLFGDASSAMSKQETLRAFENSSNWGLLKTRRFFESLVSKATPEKRRDISVLMLELGETVPVLVRDMTVIELLDKYQPLIDSLMPGHDYLADGKLFFTHLNESSLLSLGNLVRDNLAQKKECSAECATEISLMIHELAGNIQRQSRSRSKPVKLELALMVSDSGLAMVLSDDAKTLNATQVDFAGARKFQEEGPSQDSGLDVDMGLSMVVAMADHIRYKATTDGNRFVALKRFW